MSGSKKRSRLNPLTGSYKSDDPRAIQCVGKMFKSSNYLVEVTYDSELHWKFGGVEAGIYLSAPVQVRFSETDMFGHVNNTVPIAYFEFARIEFMKEMD
ncbi:acyl-CoA thioesterase [Planococcus faecalis]|uniref:acyl-CoA thioesterase n=1 Tax=Planococcus faecalis TaxID=1598147 RepID=UPI0034E93EFB